MADMYTVTHNRHGTHSPTYKAKWTLTDRHTDRSGVHATSTLTGDTQPGHTLPPQLPGPHHLPKLCLQVALLHTEFLVSLDHLPELFFLLLILLQLDGGPEGWGARQSGPSLT